MGKVADKSTEKKSIVDVYVKFVARKLMESHCSLFSPNLFYVDLYHCAFV